MEISYAEAILLGLVQGLGEFLPISSSAHLLVAPWLLHWQDAGLGYSVALHLGTLFAVVGYYWRDWLQLTVGSVRYALKRREPDHQHFREMLFLILATIPAALAGYFLEDYADSVFRAPWITILTMTGLGLLLWRADNQAQKNAERASGITLQIALIIGSAQALALVPGVSRSGITITTALLLGLSRVQAARFSFLLSTPIVFGACLLKSHEVGAAFSHPAALTGLIVSAVAGFLSIALLLKWIKTSSYKVFSIYRFAFAAIVLFVYVWRRLGEG